MEQENLADEETADNKITPTNSDAQTVIDPNDKEAVIARLQEELAAEHSKVSEADDKLKRTIAESMNMRKRMDKQVADAIDRASAHIIGRLLPVLDDLDLAFQNLPEGLADEKASWLNGIRQIQKKLEMLLEEQNVIKFADVGLLDPTRHEAILSQPHEELESGSIIETVRPGYEQKGRIIRAALVKVAL